MIGDNPTTLDPAHITDIYGGAVVRQIFNGLIQFDANLKPVPDLAEFWQGSRDGLTWTFTLRQGVKFHHGREMTAQDVVYSFTRLLDPSRSLPVTDLFRSIQGAKDFTQRNAATVQGLKAVDRHTVQIVLEEPLSPFLAVLGLTNTFVVPQDEVERLGEAFGRAPVGTGPFKFARWQPNREIALEANDQYYEGRPFLDTVIFKIMVGAKLEETFAEFLKGHLEETIIPSGHLNTVQTDPRYRHYRSVHKPMLNLVYIGFNTQLKPFTDRRVRQAFNYAVNRKAIVQHITQRGSLLASGILPPGMPGYNPELTGYAYDPARARRLLAAAGYPGGAGLPVVQLWSVHKAASTRAELAAYQADLADLGVQVEIRFASDWTTYKALMEQGKLPMFRLLWAADIPDPDNFLSPLLHSRSSTNRTFYRNAVVDRLLDQARKTSDETQRMALYRKVEQLATNDAPWITQHHSVLNYLYQPYVQGVKASLLGKRGIPLQAIWLEKEP
jgi:peptide/nickel transport system substrate-binding protein/oligopeptide transport system substrate-binding protein